MRNSVERVNGGASLRFSRVELRDTGMYTCIAQNPLATSVNASINIAVEGRYTHTHTHTHTRLITSLPGKCRTLQDTAAKTSVKYQVTVHRLWHVASKVCLPTTDYSLTLSWLQSWNVQ